MIPGLQRDLELLIKNFTKTNSLRYSDFCTCWKKLNFSKITNSCTSNNDYQVLLEGIYSLCFNYFYKKYAYNIQTASLYILYSIFFLINKPDPETVSIRYYKERTNNPILIRVTFENYENLLKLVEWLENEAHLDAVWAFKCLQEYEAFLFCVQTIPATRSSLWTHRLISADIRSGLPALKSTSNAELSQQVLSQQVVQQGQLGQVDQNTKIEELETKIELETGMGVDGDVIGSSPNGTNIVGSNLRNFERVESILGKYNEIIEKSSFEEKEGLKRSRMDLHDMS